MKNDNLPHRQLALFSGTASPYYSVPFPSTRYQGSKRKLTAWIWDNVASLEFDTVLDVFGGTGAVSHLFKRYGKEVAYNDYLVFNWNVGLALIENASVTLTLEDVDAAIKKRVNVDYPDLIQTHFQGIYFTDAENAWLDAAVHNINTLFEDVYKQALARFALYQACIAKRPYNLFHRANLYMRQAAVERSFGNKATWDTPFEAHFRAFVTEANTAVFDNHRHNRAIQLDAFETPIGADLVYLDPPYLNANGVGVDYYDFYHFLEGLTDYPAWAEKIDFVSKHRRLIPQPSLWHNAGTILEAFEALIERHRKSILVISYRDDGIPSKEELIGLLRKVKKEVHQAELSQKYVLSKKNSHEILLIGV